MAQGMKQVTIRELRANIKDLLTDLPFEIIDGKTKNKLAMVTPALPDHLVYETADTPQVRKNIKNIQKDPIKQAEEFVKPLVESSTWWTCSHGGRGKLCWDVNCKMEARKRGDL